MVTRPEKEKVVGSVGVAEWRLVCVLSTSRGKLQRLASLIAAGVVSTREVMADVRLC